MILYQVKNIYIYTYYPRDTSVSWHEPRGHSFPRPRDRPGGNRGPNAADLSAQEFQANRGVVIENKIC